MKLGSLEAAGGSVNGQNGGMAKSTSNGVVRRSETQDELVRLMVQSLQGMGLRESADALQSESGLSLESPVVSAFREGVLSGDWDKVMRALPSLDINSRDIQIVRFMLLEQRYLEALEAGTMAVALEVLRQDLSPMEMNTKRIHQLASFMMCADAATLRSRAGWDGAQGISRTELLQKLQS
ncbi:hypothetical protein HKX48_008181 [Thoreauomyces humboldtii]|nr:hypothetical protein HKX48_008181 [Thoreauomyces humboldtii]